MIAQKFFRINKLMILFPHISLCDSLYEEIFVCVNGVFSSSQYVAQLCDNPHGFITQVAKTQYRLCFCTRIENAKWYSVDC